MNYFVCYIMLEGESKQQRIKVCADNRREAEEAAERKLEKMGFHRYADYTIRYVAEAVWCRNCQAVVVEGDPLHARHERYTREHLCELEQRATDMASGFQASQAEAIIAMLDKED